MVANKDESLEVQNAEDTTKVDTIGEEVANSEQQSTSLEQQNNDYSYEAGVQQINNMYDQSAEAIQAEYEQQWQKQRDEYQNTRDDVGKTYWEQQNDLANQYNVARRNMAMNDVANGLNTGTFYNRQESLSNVYYNNNAQLETAKSEQIAELDKAMADLDSEYQKQVNEALANNELERAQKLYDEWNSGYTKAMEKAQILGNYGDFSGYKDLGYSDEEIAAMVAEYNSSKEEVEAEKALERAQTLATYGDFSGYLRAGYTLEEVQKMQNMWISQNAQVAYMSGMITEDTYKAIIDGTLNGNFNAQGTYDLNEIAKEIKQEQQVNTVVADVVNNSSELLTPVAYDDTYGSSSLSAEEKRKIMENVGLLDYLSIADYNQYWKTNTEDTTTNSNLPTSVSSDSLAGQIQRDNIGARTADTTQAYRNRYAYNLAQSYTPSRINSNTNTTLPSAQAAQNAAVTQQAKNIREELSGATAQKPLTTTNTAYSNAEKQYRRMLASDNAKAEEQSDAELGAALRTAISRDAEQEALQRRMYEVWDVTNNNSYGITANLTLQADADEYVNGGKDEMAMAQAQARMDAGHARADRKNAEAEYNNPVGKQLQEQEAAREIANNEMAQTQQAKNEGYNAGTYVGSPDYSVAESLIDKIAGIANESKIVAPVSDAKPDEQVAREIYWQDIIDNNSDITRPLINGTPYGSYYPANETYKASGVERTIIDPISSFARDPIGSILEVVATDAYGDDNEGQKVVGDNWPYSQRQDDNSLAQQSAKDTPNNTSSYNKITERQQNNRDMASQATVTHGATEEQIDRDYGNMIRSGVKLSPAAQTVLEQEQAYIDAEIARQRFMAETQANFDRLNALNNWYAQNGFSQTPPENVSDDEVAIVYDAVTGAGFVNASSYSTDRNDYQIQDYNYGNGYTNQVVETFGPQY